MRVVLDIHTRGGGGGVAIHVAMEKIITYIVLMRLGQRTHLDVFPSSRVEQMKISSMDKCPTKSHLRHFIQL